MKPLIRKNFINEATAFAKKAHEGQFRKGGNNIPYITHPIAVAGILRDGGFSVEAQVAGVLHDVVEDCGVSEDTIADTFGNAVRALVSYVSEQDKSLTWKERKIAYIERLANGPEDALAVSAADKLHNLRCTYDDFEEHGEQIFVMFNSTSDGQFWYYETLIEMFKEQSRLKEMVDEMEMMLSTIKMGIALSK
jgi:(p)ppGpp synthase/HD superfamily hydrolase